MWDHLVRLFSADFMPHGHCYFWEPGMVWLQVVANLSIGLAYLSISATLVYMVRRAPDVPFQWVYLAFGLFIVSCGITHFMDVWVIWTPVYWLDGSVRAVTAVASVGTAVLLFPLVPKATALARAARLARERGTRLEQLNVELAALYEQARETIAEAIPQLVWTAEPDGTRDYVNARWMDYAGERPTSDEAWRRVFHPDDVERVISRWEESVKNGEPYALETRIRRKDGAYRWFLVQGLPLRSRGGAIVKWFGACTDIHDQKLAAEERERVLAQMQEAVRTRDVFLAVAAHELRTPLTPLRLEVERLLRAARAGHAERLAPERAAERLQIVERQLGRLEERVDVLLDVTRIAGGRFELHLDDVDLGAVVSEVAERLKPDAQRAGCALTVRAEPGIVGRWDRLRLDQIVTNLVTNALRYGQGAPVAIEARAEDGRARLRVSDQGIGVAPEDQARIFGRFERAASERHYGGLGLGLWISRQLVEALGGSIRVESALGEGATFVVELPLAR